MYAAGDFSDIEEKARTESIRSRHSVHLSLILARLVAL
jgi:hypothetical protein